MLEYRGRVKQSREQFRRELECVVPDVKIGPRLDGTLAYSFIVAFARLWHIQSYCQCKVHFYCLRSNALVNTGGPKKRIKVKTGVTILLP